MTEFVITNLDAARITHEANRALQVILADPAIPVAPPWDELPDEDRASIINGVELHRDSPTSARLSHENWCNYKLAQGWVYGKVKDATMKTHPCLVDFDRLPPADRLKDSLFKAIVEALPAPGA